MRRGPARNAEMIKQVKTLRAKGLSFRQIAKLLDKDVKNIYLWYKYDVGELSTGRRLTVGKK